MAVSDLPEKCCAYLMPGNVPIMITRGESGYHRLDCSSFVEYYNEQKKITKEQVECMVIGSMFGWDVPGADPANFTANREASRVMVLG